MAPYTNSRIFFFFNDTATTEIYTLSLHDALPICHALRAVARACRGGHAGPAHRREEDRKSTRLNSSHSQISYAVFCLKKKKTNQSHRSQATLRETPRHRRRPIACTPDIHSSRSLH